MRNISFSLTTNQFIARTKDVTRRVGWARLKVDDLLCGVEKGMGLKPGQTVRRLGVIRVVSVSREPLQRMLADRTYGLEECRREGFPQMEPEDFVAFFCTSHKSCRPDTPVTRIEFVHIDGGQHG